MTFSIKYRENKAFVWKRTTQNSREEVMLCCGLLVLKDKENEDYRSWQTSSNDTLMKTARKLYGDANEYLYVKGLEIFPFYPEHLPESKK